MQRVGERLDQLAQSLHELRDRRDAAVDAGRAARSREAARNAVEMVNTRLAEAQAELEGLRTAMHNRGVIEQAKGMLMLRLQVDENQAFEYLRALSNRTNRKLADVASEVILTRAGESAME